MAVTWDQPLLPTSRLRVTNLNSMSGLAIMHELTVRPVSSLIVSEQMNLAGVREWTRRSKSDHWQAGHGSSRASYITDGQYHRPWRVLTRFGTLHAGVHSVLWLLKNN